MATDYKPIEFKLDIKGIEELEKKLQAISVKMEDLLFQATSEAAAVVVREAKINSGKGGNLPPKKRGQPQVIPPNTSKFPRRITGNLMRSIKPIKQTRSPTRAEVQVGSAMKYALRLEYGFTGPDSKGRTFHQPPRPYLRPALDENKDKINETFAEKIKKTLGGSGSL